MKPIEIDTIVSLRSKYNINRLKLFHFENDINNILGYNDIRSYKYTFYVLRPLKLKLYL